MSIFRGILFSESLSIRPSAINPFTRTPVIFSDRLKGVHRISQAINWREANGLTFQA